MNAAEAYQKSRITALIQATAEIVKPADAPEMLAMVSKLRRHTADDVHGYYQKPETGSFVFTGTNGLVSYELELQPHVVEATRLIPTKADILPFQRRSRFVPMTADVVMSEVEIAGIEAFINADVQEQ